MNRIDPEQAYTPTEISKLLPRPVSPRTVWRWVLKGVRGRSLPSTMLGGRRIVYGEDLIAFLDGGKAGSKSAPQLTPAQISRESRKASERLAKAGW